MYVLRLLLLPLMILLGLVAIPIVATLRLLGARSDGYP
jgi:hypothetical protein